MHRVQSGLQEGYQQLKSSFVALTFFPKCFKLLFLGYEVAENYLLFKISI